MALRTDLIAAKKEEKGRNPLETRKLPPRGDFPTLRRETEDTHFLCRFLDLGARFRISCFPFLATFLQRVSSSCFRRAESIFGERGKGKSLASVGPHYQNIETCALVDW